MRQGIFNVILRPAKSYDAHLLSIDKSPLVQIVDRSLESSHLVRTLVHASVVFHVIPRLGSVSDLQDHDPFCREGLRRKRAVPWAIYPEFSFGKRVGLDDKRVVRPFFVAA